MEIKNETNNKQCPIFKRFTMKVKLTYKYKIRRNDISIYVEITQ